MMRTLFILGAAGFIGRETVSAALEGGWRVIALARSEESAARLRGAGAQAITGDVGRPGAWIDEALAGRTFVVTDGADTTQGELLDYTAGVMGVRRPPRVLVSLAALVAGRVAVEVIARDVHADPAALLGTGFAFRYPSYREGVPATLAALGPARQAARAVHA